MKKLEITKYETIKGGIRWKSFAEGFCDGFTLGSLIVGGYASAAGIEGGCNALGIGSNILQNLR